MTQRPVRAWHARSTPHRPLVQSARLLAAALFCLAITPCISCTGAFRNPFRPGSPPVPEVLLPGASLADVIAAINANADRLQTLQTTNASITVPGIPGVPLLRGNIAAMRPGRMRIEASAALLGKQVDMGANDDAFWFWTKQNNPPGVYFVRRDQLAQGAAAGLMPIDPQWLLDALGFARLDPAGFHEGPTVTSNGSLEIRSIVQTPRGPVAKLTVVDAKRGVILEQHAYDGQGALIASARTLEHRYDPSVQVAIPQRLELRLVAADLALTIDLGTPALNAALPNPAVWTMPVMPGVPLVDLANAPEGLYPSMGQTFNQTGMYDIPAATVPSASLDSPYGSAVNAMPQGSPPTGTSNAPGWNGAFAPAPQSSGVPPSAVPSYPPGAPVPNGFGASNGYGAPNAYAPGSEPSPYA
ncbi:MAG: hypothetical protein KDA61_19305, partial [Planctomycetales bacterium]|nr:hypothetical protein [Planctomycetales bacterium]